MSTKLTLVPVEKVSRVQPAVLHEKDALVYIGTNRTYFRELVQSGEIRAYSHIGRRGRIYFKEDLDAYLRRVRMAGSESPLVSLKGAAR